MRPSLSTFFLQVILVTLVACRPTPDTTKLFTPTPEITATSTPTATARPTTTTAVPTSTPGTLPPLPPITGKVNLKILGSIGGNFKGFALRDDLAILSVGLRLEVLSLGALTPLFLSNSSGYLPEPGSLMGIFVAVARFLSGPLAILSLVLGWLGLSDIKNKGGIEKGRVFAWIGILLGAGWIFFQWAVAMFFILALFF